MNVAADEAASNYTTVPEQGALKLTPSAAYVHYTPNETIGGVEFPYVPQTGGVPLVADMSSTILSRPIDVSKFGVIYASAQKNIGPSGLAVVIVREDLLGRARSEHAFRARLQGDGGRGLHVEHAADLRLVSRGPRLQVAEGEWRPRRGWPSATREGGEALRRHRLVGFLQESRGEELPLAG